MRANEPHQDWLDEWLERIENASVGVFGDFCLDAYWQIDADVTELSVETGLPVRRVRQQRYSLGGAGNIVANLRALGVRNVRAAGLIGNDPFGRLMLDLLRDAGADAAPMSSCQQDWQTMVYIKPHAGKDEQSRIDLGAFNAIAPDAVEALAHTLERLAESCDAVILNQQVSGGTSTSEMIGRINAVIARNPRCRFLVDSRHRTELYAGAMVKLNAHEAARICGSPRPLGEAIPAKEAASFALKLFARTGLPVFITRGAEGIAAVDKNGLHQVPGIRIKGPVDPVGAGDTVAAALAAVMAAGGNAETAARLANIAASVTVRKLRTTGTATPEEIRQAAKEQ